MVEAMNPEITGRVVFDIERDNLNPEELQS